jgi:hypothetical protein
MRRLILDRYGMLYNSVLFLKTVSHVEIRALLGLGNGNAIRMIKTDKALSEFFKTAYETAYEYLKRSFICPF